MNANPAPRYRFSHHDRVQIRGIAYIGNRYDRRGYTTERVAVNGELGTSYLAFFAQHEAVLSLLFDGAAMQTLQNVATDIERNLSINIPSDLPPAPPQKRGLFGFLRRSPKRRTGH